MAPGNRAATMDGEPTAPDGVAAGFPFPFASCTLLAKSSIPHFPNGQAHLGRWAEHRRPAQPRLSGALGTFQMRERTHLMPGLACGDYQQRRKWLVVHIGYVPALRGWLSS
eukprot:1902624-Rhodomonas_salina.4